MCLSPCVWAWKMRYMTKKRSLSDDVKWMAMCYTEHDNEIEKEKIWKANIKHLNIAIVMIIMNVFMASAWIFFTFQESLWSQPATESHRTRMVFRCSSFQPKWWGKKNARRESFWKKKWPKASSSRLLRNVRRKATFLPIQVRTSVKVQVIWMRVFHSAREFHKEICKILFLFRFKYSVLRLDPLQGKEKTGRHRKNEKIKCW